MDSLNMIVSGVIERKGKKSACVRFEGQGVFAEGYIPDCKIEKSEGFSEEEIKTLEEYLTDNLETLKRHAAGIDPIVSMIRE